MDVFPTRSGALVCLCLIVACSLPVFVCAPVAAADVSIEAEMGDTINLNGISYIGDRVYLFLTGPGLPDNGVMLTDVSQRADQGHFTLVDVGSDQTWSMRWNTARIQNEIDPGTYIVYVSNEPVDKAHLGGSNTYKTLEIFLKESSTDRVSVSSGPSYTLNPESHTSTVQAPMMPALTSPVPTPTTLPPTTKAPLQPTTAIVAGILCAGCILLTKKK